VTVFQSERDDMFDGVKDLIPGGAERIGRFFPRKTARPTGQKQHVSIGQLMLAVAPGNFLNDYGFAAAAIDAPPPKEGMNSKRRPASWS